MVLISSSNRLVRNGPSRKTPFDNWFRYPAGFSEEALAACFAAVPATPGHLVVDPFAGASIAGVRIAAQGGLFRGIEAHPLVAELSNLKFQRPAAIELMEYAQTVMQETVLADPEQEHELVRRCFEEGTLSVLAGLRDRIERAPENLWHKYLRWALLATLRDCASVKVGWPYQRPGRERAPLFKDPKKRFLDRVNVMVVDLTNAPKTSDGRIIHGDSRDAAPWDEVLNGQLADGCITSPPYLNNFDYADATRLELYFLRYASSWREMTEVVRSTMMIASTQQTNRPSADLALETLAAVPDVFETVKELGGRLAEERAKRRTRNKGRTKEYDLLVYQYFADMRFVVTHLERHLMSGATVAMIVGDSAPYGVYVDTPGIIAMLGEHVGLQCVHDVPIRARGQRWANNAVRHSVPLAERVLVLRKP